MSDHNLHPQWCSRPPPRHLSITLSSLNRGHTTYNSDETQAWRRGRWQLDVGAALSCTELAIGWQRVVYFLLELLTVSASDSPPRWRCQSGGNIQNTDRYNIFRIYCTEKKLLSWFCVFVKNIHFPHHSEPKIGDLRKNIYIFISKLGSRSNNCNLFLMEEDTQFNYFTNKTNK